MRRSAPLAIAILLVSPLAHANDDLLDMSLEELMNVEVTSASKKAQSKQDVAAAITVITSEDIRRGGFTLLPEVLRTVPGIQVARVDANHWSISGRGDNSLFSNNLLVLIDGRSVYTPTFGGVYWNEQDYPLEDIDRIEVIRGPGGSVWGTNAVNGVINIITKNAADTQGTLVSAYGGDYEAGATGRFGGTFGEDDQTAYRAYVRGFRQDDQAIDERHDGNDEWRSIRTGFRMDSQLSETDAVRVSADYFDIKNDQNLFNPGVPPPLFNRADYEQRGGNILVEWSRSLDDGSGMRAKAYYDRANRQFLVEEDRHTAEVELQHDSMVFDAIDLSLGSNYRFTTSHTGLTSRGLPVLFDSNDEDLHVASVFVQGAYGFLEDRVTITAGTKLTYHSWSGFEYQPSARFVAKPMDGHSIWGAISRAVRTPTQTDRDLTITIPIPGPSTVTLTGDRGFRSEELVAYELGYRFTPTDWLSAELALFWNEYEEELVLVAPLGPPPFTTINLNAQNRSSRGFELELNAQPADWIRLRAAYTYLTSEERIGGSLPPGTFKLNLGGGDRSDPKHQFTGQAFVSLPYAIDLDVSVYYVDGLPGVLPAGQTQNVEQYVRLDLRLGYEPTDWLELSLVGQNLIDRRHYESQDTTLSESTQVPRSFYGKATLRF